jgi:8-oxo-dGTP diphosphatase
MATTHWHVTTLVYVIRDGSLLLMHRRKSPNLGLWSPPGGKIEPGESPVESALRELREETGLEGIAPHLAAVVHESDTVRNEEWLMFVVRAEVPSGEPVANHREGVCRWVPLESVADLPTPPADPYILRAVLSNAPGVSLLTVTSEGGRLVGVRTAVVPCSSDASEYR